jgi:hypothetical protein
MDPCRKTLGRVKSGQSAHCHDPLTTSGLFKKTQKTSCLVKREAKPLLSLSFPKVARQRRDKFKGKFAKNRFQRPIPAASIKTPYALRLRFRKYEFLPSQAGAITGPLTSRHGAL